MHEGLAFKRGWCLQSLAPTEGLLGAALPVLPAFALSWPVPGVCPAAAVRGRDPCSPFSAHPLCMRDGAGALNYSVTKVSGKARI